MLGFKCFVFSLFIWLSFISPEQNNGDALRADGQSETIASTSNSDNQTLIFDKNVETNQANWSVKTFKLHYLKDVEKNEQPNAKKKLKNYFKGSR